MPDDATRSLPANPNEPTLTLEAAVLDVNPITSFGDYELTSEIARGGMGVVLRGRQRKLNRPVAVKMLLAGMFASETERERFRHEAEAAAGLEHPNILPIYEVSEHQGRAFFSMKLVDGGTLAQKLKQTPRPGLRELVDLLAKVCRAVDHAHRRGILHRDLKPSNVLIDEAGTPFVADFGLAKKTDSDDLLTRTGAVVGTPSYMSPEQARGEKGLTTSVDVYSLAAILYEILAGRPPFMGETMMATLRKVIDDMPDDPRSSSADADRDLSVVAMKGLSKEPSRRYPSAAALADDLDRWLRGEPVTARPTTQTERLVRWTRRNPGLAILTASLAAALFIGTFVSISFAVEAKRQARDADNALQKMKAAEQETAAEIFKADDALCRNHLVEARAFRLAGEPGWRTLSLERLREAARLLRRDRGSYPEGDLPALGELRGEAILCLLRNDARLVRTIPSGFNDTPTLSGDGTMLLSKFNRFFDNKITYGLRGLQIRDGTQVFSHEVTLALSGLSSGPDLTKVQLYYSSQLSMNANGSRLLSVDLTGSPPKLMDTKDFKVIRQLSSPSKDVRYFGARFSPDERYVLAWEYKSHTDRTLRLWDLSTDAPPRSLFQETVKENPPDKGPQPPKSERKLLSGFTPRGDVWYFISDNEIQVLDPAADASKAQVHHLEGVRVLAWHPTKPIFAAITQQGDAKTAPESLTARLVLWDSAARKEILQRPLRKSNPNSYQSIFQSGEGALSFSPNGRFLALADNPGMIDLLDAATGREILRFPVGATEGIQTTGWTADNDLVVKPQMEAIQVWRISTTENLRSTLDLGLSQILAVSRDHRWLLSSSHGHGDRVASGMDVSAPVKLVDLTTGAVRPFPKVGHTSSAVFHPDGRALAFLDQTTLVEVSIPEGNELRRDAGPSQDGYTGWAAVHYLPSGRLIAQPNNLPRFGINPTAKPNNEQPKPPPPFNLWDVETRRPLLPVGGDLSHVQSAVAPSGSFLVLNPNEGVESIVNFFQKANHRPPKDWQVIGLPDGEMRGRVPLDQLNESASAPLGISPDGRWLMVGNMNFATGRELTFSDMSLQIHKLPAGERILHRKVQPSDTGNEHHRFAHTLPVVAFGNRNGAVDLWHLEPTASLLARWQPYGSQRIADFGFIGDMLYLRADGAAQHDFLRLSALQQQLQAMDLGW